MEKEIWLPIKEYENLYEISNLGRIKSLIKKGSSIEKIKKNGFDVNTGYINVQLRKNNIPLTKRVHRMVAIAFIPNPLNKPCVNHKDGDKKNCKASNLEWMTYSENTLHSFKNGLQKKIFGNKNYITKLKDSDVIEIRDLIKKQISNKEIALLYKVNPSQISRIKNNKRRHNIM
jgi:hypothetical protein|tara:strand:- start:3359 stop:3880 length:522 start_codon:yes stop_codon:yes gene_type:complete